MQTTMQPSVFVNGEVKAMPSDTSLASLLETLGVDVESVRGIAVAVNDTVVRRSHWASYQLEDQDRVEVITAKQGG